LILEKKLFCVFLIVFLKMKKKKTKPFIFFLSCFKSCHFLWGVGGLVKWGDISTVLSHSVAGKEVGLVFIQLTHLSCHPFYFVAVQPGKVTVTVYYIYINGFGSR